MSNLLSQIEQGYPKFSKSHKRIADFILHNYEKAAYCTAARLGAETGISESTVVRFATHLGFEGYPEFQAAGPCRFPGCMHISEPGCGVKKLLSDGRLSPARFERYVQIAKDFTFRRKHQYD